jgi:hypothetical protein
MKNLFPRILLLAFGVLCFADTPAKQLTGFPFQDETLKFNVNWPGGTSLGQARMQARRVEDERWDFELTLDASVPGFTVTDRYHSVATADLCSVEFERDSMHGKKKSHETVKFNQDRNMAHRVTNGGGSSDFAVPDCAKDALTFLYFTRREMGQGRVPLETTIALGGPYSARLDYKGEEALKESTTDKVATTVRGPSSDVNFELLFARDPARTPLLVRAPFPLGVFSLELAR